MKFTNLQKEGCSQRNMEKTYLEVFKTMISRIKDGKPQNLFQNYCSLSNISGETDSPSSFRWSCKAQLIVDNQMQTTTNIKMWQISQAKCLHHNPLENPSK